MKTLANLRPPVIYVYEPKLAENSRTVRKLLASDQREILNLLHRELSGVPAKSAPEHRKSIAESPANTAPDPTRKPPVMTLDLPKPLPLPRPARFPSENGVREL